MKINFNQAVKIHFMNVGLFIPGYIDQFYPGVAIATYQLLRNLDARLAILWIRPAAANGGK